MLFNLIKISLYFLRKQMVELCDRKNWEKSVFINTGYISMIIVNAVDLLVFLSAVHTALNQKV